MINESQGGCCIERLAGLELLLHQKPRGSNEHNFALRPTRAAAAAAAAAAAITIYSRRVKGG
jgi:hypothetical protein